MSTADPRSAAAPAAHRPAPIDWVLVALGLGAATWSLVGTVPFAWEQGYGQLPAIAPLVTGWAMWLGHRYGRPGPWGPRAGRGLLAGTVAAALVAIGVGLPGLAGYAVAPLAWWILARLAPRLATARIGFLWLLVPTGHFLDLAFGESLRLGTAIGAAWLTQLVDPELGLRTDNALSCGPHTVLVTAACSGARFSVRMVTLAAVLAVLKPPPARGVLVLLATGLGFAVAANLGRIAVLCLAAPSYPPDDALGVELFHDASGLVAFVLAYLGLALLGRRLARAAPGTSATGG